LADATGPNKTFAVPRAANGKVDYGAAAALAAPEEADA